MRFYGGRMKFQAVVILLMVSLGTVAAESKNEIQHVVVILQEDGTQTICSMACR